ncbi:hypothetical protein L3Q67_02645 [Saccharothrix sp. AJ9571]|nr:hypothetical protein L3Q67_02645 [Saccharothrix sp. AJ9571]
MFEISLAEAEQWKAELAAKASAVLPASLYREWHSFWWHRGDEALVGVEQGDCRGFGWFVRRASEQIVDAAAKLSSIEELQPCVAHVGVTDKLFWMAGIRHIAGVDAPVPSDGSVVAAKLGQRLRARAELVVNAVAGDGVAAGTAALTQMIERWAGAHGRGERRWRCHREVFVPTIREGGSLSGIVDLVIERPALPDVVIVIDSTNKGWSAQKLSFVREAGGVPIWVRWHRGPVRRVRGLHVIDVTRCCFWPGKIDSA